MSRTRTVIVANDVVPGMGLPVAAPGLRAHGLKTGLAAAGFDVEIVLPSGPVDSVWVDAMPPPSTSGVSVINRQALAEYLMSRIPAVVVFTNSNHVDYLPRDPGLRYVFDFFAPKMLETAYKYGKEYPSDELRALAERKVRGLDLANAVIVNGSKKVGYVLAWILRSNHDVRRLRVEVVPMAVPNRFRDRSVGSPMKAIIGGYLQGWNAPGDWLEQLHGALAENLLEIHLFRSAHWGQQEESIDTSALERMLSAPGVIPHEALLFSDYQDLLSEMDVTLDVFPRTRERELAMVTRAVVSIACGVPVIHPSFTELSPLIEASGAGWLIDSPQDLPAALEGILREPARVEEAAAASRKLWQTTFKPEVAVAPLAAIVRSLASEF